MDELTYRCPHMITRAAEDESWDFCDLNDKLCLLMGDNQCDIYDEAWAEDMAWADRQ